VKRDVEATPLQNVQKTMNKQWQLKIQIINFWKSTNIQRNIKQLRVLNS